MAERTAVTPTRKVLTAKIRRIMLACVIRNAAVFNEVRDHLKPAVVSEVDAVYGAVLGLVHRYHDDHGELPPEEILRAEVEALADGPQAGIGDFDDHDLDAAVEFVDFAFSGPFDGLPQGQVDWAVSRVRLFLEEHLHRHTTEQLDIPNEVASDLPRILSDLHARAEAYASLTGGGEIRPVFSDGWDVRAETARRPTGFSFFDEYLNGGQVGGEVYSVMAPYGSCKTLCGVAVTAEAAAGAYERRLQPGWDGVREMAFFVSFEAPLAEFQDRILMYMGRIHKDSLERRRDLSSLSTAEGLKDYERKLFADLIRSCGRADGERERVQRVLPVVNDHVHFVSMIGGKGEDAHRGEGYIEEVEREISRVCRKLGVRPCLVWIDYAGAMADRHIAAGHAKQDHLRHLLKRLPLAARNKIGMPHGCPVWINQQFAGEVQNTAPAVPLHHSMAAESKAFGENCDFCFCFGNLTLEGLTVLNCSKHRRNAPLPPKVVRVVGEFGRIEDVSPLYAIDSNRRKIVDRDDVTRVTALPPAPAGRGGSVADME